MIATNKTYCEPYIYKIYDSYCQMNQHFINVYFQNVNNELKAFVRFEFPNRGSFFKFRTVLFVCFGK